MSEPHNDHLPISMASGEPTSSWLERHWYWLTIAFGLLLVIAIDLFAPVQ